MRPAAIARYEAGLSIDEAAARSGVHPRTVRRIETGETVTPSAGVARKLADAYGVTVAQLLGFTTASPSGVT